MRKIRIDKLRDIGAINCRLVVEEPVPTPTGPREIDHDDDVLIQLHLPGGVVVRAEISAAAYERITDSMEREHVMPLPLDAPA